MSTRTFIVPSDSCFSFFCGLVSEGHKRMLKNMRTKNMRRQYKGILFSSLTILNHRITREANERRTSACAPFAARMRIRISTTPHACVIYMPGK